MSPFLAIANGRERTAGGTTEVAGADRKVKRLLGVGARSGRQAPHCCDSTELRGLFTRVCVGERSQPLAALQSHQIGLGLSDNSKSSAAPRRKQTVCGGSGKHGGAEVLKDLSLILRVTHLYGHWPMDWLKMGC